MVDFKKLPKGKKTVGKNFNRSRTDSDRLTSTFLRSEPIRLVPITLNAPDYSTHYEEAVGSGQNGWIRFEKCGEEDSDCAYCAEGRDPAPQMLLAVYNVTKDFIELLRIRRIEDDENSLYVPLCRILERDFTPLKDAITITLKDGVFTVKADYNYVKLSLRTTIIEKLEHQFGGKDLWEKGLRRAQDNFFPLYSAEDLADKVHWIRNQLENRVDATEIDTERQDSSCIGDEE